MKKLIAFTAAATLSGFAMAGDIDKIDTDFDSLDNNDDMYISMEEADDNNIWVHFHAVDTDDDKRISHKEFMDYVTKHPDMVEEGEDIPEMDS